MKIILGNEEIHLDPALTRFTEATLNEFLQKDAAIYSYYNAKLVDAQYISQKCEDMYDVLYSKKFQHYKEQGSTDKLADALAKSDDEVVDAKESARLAKRNKDHIWGFLKSLDKAHENALNLGYNIRKEMNVMHHQHIKSLDEIIN